MSHPKPNAKLPDPVGIELMPSSYQATKAEMEDEFDTPDWTMDQRREIFMRPYVVKKS